MRFKSLIEHMGSRVKFLEPRVRHRRSQFPDNLAYPENERPAKNGVHKGTDARFQSLLVRPRTGW